MLISKLLTIYEFLAKNFIKIMLEQTYVKLNRKFCSCLLVNFNFQPWATMWKFLKKIRARLLSFANTLPSNFKKRDGILLLLRYAKLLVINWVNIIFIFTNNFDSYAKTAKFPKVNSNKNMKRLDRCENSAMLKLSS